MALAFRHGEGMLYRAVVNETPVSDWTQHWFEAAQALLRCGFAQFLFGTLFTMLPLAKIERR